MKTISKESAQKIIRNHGILETATYRYIYDTESGSFKRIRKEYLDTTEAYTKWETVTVK